MNIIKTIDQYNEKYVYFNEPIQNNIINNGTFSRILYSTDNCTLNGIYLLVQFDEIICNLYFNKFKCNFNINTNKEIIIDLKVIEENLLKKINIKNKQPQYKLHEQLKNGNIKIFNNIDKNTYLFNLKISGIWETITHYGLTYKFVKIN